MTVKKLTQNWLKLAILFIFPFTLSQIASAAGSATFSFEPSGGEIQQGSFTVSVFTNSDSVEVTTARANISYDSSRFEFTGFDATSSEYGAEADQSGGGGNISVTRFVTPIGSSVSGKKLLIKLNFKAVSPGAGQIQIQNSSDIMGKDNTSAWDGALTAANYTVVSTSSPDTDTAVINNNPATATTDPTGTNNDGGRHTDDAEPQPTVEQQQANPEAPIPVNTNAANDMKTYHVAITLKDKNGAILPDTSIRLGEDGQTATTDSNGVAGFVGVRPGVYDLYIDTPEGEIRRTISVSEDPEGESSLQEFTIDLSQNKADDNTLLLIISGIAVAVIVAVAGYLLLRGRGNGPGRGGSNFEASPGPSEPVADQGSDVLSKIYSDVPGPSTVISPNKNQ